MVRSIIDIRPHQFSSVVYYMFRDGKRQAAAAGILHRRSMTPVTGHLWVPGGIIAATALEFFHGGKIVRLN
jgi:hypothetical protein